MNVIDWLLENGWVVMIAVFIGLMIICYMALNHVEEVGLKNIVMTVWNGTGG